MVFLDATLFYFRLRTHLRLLYLQCIKHFSIRNFLIGIGYFLVLFLVSLINIIIRLLDELLFPNYKQISIKQPVFIIGNPRSGTTFLHRLMCIDEEKFVFNLMYHTTFPSITLYRVIQFLKLLTIKLVNP